MLALSFRHVVGIFRRWSELVPVSEPLNVDVGGSAGLLLSTHYYAASDEVTRTLERRRADDIDCSAECDKTQFEKFNEELATWLRLDPRTKILQDFGKDVPLAIYRADRDANFFQPAGLIDHKVSGLFVHVLKPLQQVALKADHLVALLVHADLNKQHGREFPRKVINTHVADVSALCYMGNITSYNALKEAVAPIRSKILTAENVEDVWRRVEARRLRRVRYNETRARFARLQRG